jgi:hypothetical protein
MGVHPPPSPAWANFTVMIECTPESSRCYSVYLWCVAPSCECYTTRQTDMSGKTDHVKFTTVEDRSQGLPLFSLLAKFCPARDSKSHVLLNRDGIHKRTLSFGFLGIISRVLRLEVSTLVFCLSTRCYSNKPH